MKCEHLLVQLFTADLEAGEARANSQLWSFPSTWISQVDTGEQGPEQPKSWKDASADVPGQTFSDQRWPIVRKWFRHWVAYEDTWTLPPWTLFVSVLPPAFVPSHTDLELQWDDRKAPTPNFSRTEDSRLVMYWVLPDVAKGDQHLVKLSGGLKLDEKEHAERLAGTSRAGPSLNDILRGYTPDAVEIVTRIITASA